MPKQIACALLHKPEKYSTDTGVLGNVATTFVTPKKKKTNPVSHQNDSS